MQMGLPPIGSLRGVLAKTSLPSACLTASVFRVEPALIPRPAARLTKRPLATPCNSAGGFLAGHTKPSSCSQPVWIVVGPYLERINSPNFNWDVAILLVNTDRSIRPLPFSSRYGTALLHRRPFTKADRKKFALEENRMAVLVAVAEKQHTSVGGWTIRP